MYDISRFKYIKAIVLYLAIESAYLQYLLNNYIVFYSFFH